MCVKLFFLKACIYFNHPNLKLLFERQAGTSIHWLTPQMPVTAGAGPAKAERSSVGVSHVGGGPVSTCCLPSVPMSRKLELEAKPGPKPGHSDMYGVWMLASHPGSHPLCQTPTPSVVTRALL